MTYHLSVKPVQRSAGRSATAAAAYRSAERIVDLRTGEIHDYARKGGVVSADIVLPDRAPEWAADRSALWNAAEQSEKRKDACVAREIEVSLPHELSADERKRLVIDFAKEMANAEGCAVDVAIHLPGKDGDDRNHHAHILRTTRKVGADGLTEKLDTEKSGRNRKADLEALRRRWADMTNERLKENDQAKRVDHRSLEAQGIKRTPTVHLGPAVTGIVQRGGHSEVTQRIAAQGVALIERARQRAAQIHREVSETMARIKTYGGELAQAQAQVAQEKAAAIKQIALDAQNERRAAEALQEAATARYVQAIGKVTNETLSTVPGILPHQVVQQAFYEVCQEAVAQAKGVRHLDPDDSERRSKEYDLEYLSKAMPRVKSGQALYVPAKYVFRIPEIIHTIIDKARAILPNSLRAMQAADIDHMTERAADVAWTRPGSDVHAVTVMQSRFVLPAEQRRLQKELEQQQARGIGKGMGR